MIEVSASIVTLSIQVCLTFRIVLIEFLLSIWALLRFFQDKKILIEPICFFKFLCGFEPIFYTTHSNEEPFSLLILHNQYHTYHLYHHKKYCCFYLRKDRNDILFFHIYQQVPCQIQQIIY